MKGSRGGKPTQGSSQGGNGGKPTQESSQGGNGGKPTQGSSQEGQGGKPTHGSSQDSPDSFEVIEIEEKEMPELDISSSDLDSRSGDKRDLFRSDTEDEPMEQSQAVRGIAGTYIVDTDNFPMSFVLPILIPELSTDDVSQVLSPFPSVSGVNLTQAEATASTTAQTWSTQEETMEVDVRPTAIEGGVETAIGYLVCGCGAVFHTLERLKNHYCLHNRQEPEVIDKTKDILKCEICQHVSVNRRTFLHHRSTHLGEKNFQCHYCGEFFHIKSALELHVLFHEHSNQLVCEFCKISFSTVAALSEHRKIHTERKRHPCTICGARFIQKVHLTQHMNKHTGENPMKCVICNAGFPDWSALRYHSIQHDKEIKPFHCSDCGDSFSEYDQLAEHSETHKDEPPLFRPRVYNCGRCHMAFGTIKDISLHYKFTHGHLCRECGHMFITKKQLRTHELTHTKGFYECYLCNQVFPSHRLLTFHAESHNDTKFNCSKCTMTFFNMDDLIHHYLFHLYEAIDQCEMCSAVFREKEALEQHINKKHKLKCALCNQVFIRTELLRTHLRNHKLKKPYYCPSCHEELQTVYQFRNHLETHANDPNE